MKPRLRSVTIRASYLAPIPTIYVGGVVANWLRSMQEAHGVELVDLTYLPDGAIRLEVCR